MPGPRRWSFPFFPLSALDQEILALCSPVVRRSPVHTEAEKLLARAVALDVFPLVFHHLGATGDGRREGLRSKWEELFRDNAVRNVYLHSELQRLLAALGAAGLRAVPLKGTTLAEQAYGELGLRTQIDLDLYVSPRQLPAAFSVLETNGYRRAIPPGLRPDQLAATGDEFTSQCFFESSGGRLPVLLELHWRLLPMREEELDAELVPFAVGPVGNTGYRLPRELNLLYLCLHAASDRWASLKSLADLAHWVVREPPDWERLLAAASRLRLRRVLSITLAALETYFQIPIPTPVQAALAVALPRRLPPTAVANPFTHLTRLSPAATHRLRLALREDFRDRLGYAARLLRPTSADLAAVRLPRSLGFVYWGVRWVRLAGLLPNSGKRVPVAVHG